MYMTPKHVREKLKKYKGLGDVVHNAIKIVYNIECGGCKKRRELLNKLIPFTKGSKSEK